MTRNFQHFLIHRSDKDWVDLYLKKEANSLKIVHKKLNFTSFMAPATAKATSKIKLTKGGTYGYDHNEVIQESKPNERNCVVDRNCNQLTPII
jgi:hypothetical protein